MVFLSFPYTTRVFVLDNLLGICHTVCRIINKEERKVKIIWWHTKKVEEWLRQNCQFELWQEMVSGIAIEWLMAETIIEALLDNGFTASDFTVS